MTFSTRMGSALALLFHLATARSGVQDPNDPRLFGPGMEVGSRLQFGTNVFPADWKREGKLTESFSEEDGLAGFKIGNLQDPKNPKPYALGTFEEVPCDFAGSTPIVTVFSQNGEKHRFTIDSGSVESYVRPSVAEALNGGKDDPLPMVLLFGHLKWIHFKVRVDRSIGVLAADNPDFKADGILGMNALACLQLKIDYVGRKLWARVSSKALESSQAGLELGAGLESIPMKRQPNGRYTIDAALGDKPVILEVDTGANLIGLNPKMVASLGFERIGDGQVLLQGGQQKLYRYLAPTGRVGKVSFLWPVVNEGPTQDDEVGGFGPSVFPHQTVIIDYPGLRLYTAIPTEDESVQQAMGQLVAGVARLDRAGWFLDMPDVFGKSRTELLKFNDLSVASVAADLHAWFKGSTAAKARLLVLYRALNKTGVLTVRQSGREGKVQISGDQ